MNLKYIMIFFIAGFAFSCSGKTPVPATAEQMASDEQNTQETKDNGTEPTKMADIHSPDFPNVVPVVSEQKIPWGSIQRTTLPWADDIIVYHEIPVFSEDNAVLKEINAYMQEINTQFLSEDNLSAAWQFEFERHQNKDTESMDEGENYVCTVDVVHIYKTDTVLSIGMSYQWFMGGVLDYGMKNYNFDVTTGKIVLLEDVYHKSLEEVRTMIIHKMKNDIQQGVLDIPEEDIDWDYLNKAERFSFYIDEDSPHVTFNKYEISYGAAGAFDIELPRP